MSQIGQTVFLMLKGEDPSSGIYRAAIKGIAGNEWALTAPRAGIRRLQLRRGDEITCIADEASAPLFLARVSAVEMAVVRIIVSGRPHPIERRGGRRAGVVLRPQSAVLRNPDKGRSAVLADITLVDIGDGGVAMHTTHALAPGDRLTLVFALENEISGATVDLAVLAVRGRPEDGYRVSAIFSDLQSAQAATRLAELEITRRQRSVSAG